jgi:YbgC/YbaW family acyl-CoA thioester hydrolase
LPNEAQKAPILFVDVDGVISLFGFPPGQIPGVFHHIDGIAHCIGADSGELLKRLATRFELVWATGWEEKANEYLPFLLGLEARELPVLTFDGRAVFGTAHWKVEAIDEYAGDRPAAWIDDNLDERCREWAEGRPAPTLLVETDAAVGITPGSVERLMAWADSIGAPAAAGPAAAEPAPAAPAATPAEAFEYRDRVRFADLDARGHLNNVAFLQFVEAAQLAFIRHVHPAYDPTSTERLGLTLSRSEVDYLSPAGFEDEIVIRVWPTDVHADRFSLSFQLRDGGQIVAEATNTMLGYDHGAGRQAEIDPRLHAGLLRLLDRG